MLHALALVACLGPTQGPHYELATTPPKYAAEFCRAIDTLAGMNVFYKSQQMILAVQADDAGTFQFGLEHGEGKDVYLVPLVAGTTKEGTLLKSRTELRELLGTTERFDDWQWRYVKAAINVLPELTKRIRIWVSTIDRKPDGGSEADVFIDAEGKSCYIVIVENGTPIRSFGPCLGPAPFAQPRSHVPGIKPTK